MQGKYAHHRSILDAFFNEHYNESIDIDELLSDYDLFMCWMRDNHPEELGNAKDIWCS